jgi:DNA-binding transcriptional LysR family regulator
MFGRLPLTALRSFEATARRGSPVHAAAELFITPGAVARNIRELEEASGFRLFNRSGGAWELTDAGKRLAPAIASSLQSMSDALALLPSDGAEMVRVGVPRAFASHVIAPRLSTFIAGKPEVFLHFDGDRQAENPRVGALDLVIRFGLPEQPPGLELILLPAATVFPVCAPARLNGDVTQWPDLPWLAFQSVDYWGYWLASSGAERRRPRSTIMFSESSMVYAAAEAGAGLAIGHSIVCREALAAGRLMQVGPAVLDERRYFILVPHEKSACASAFIAWLIEEVGRDDLPVSR